MSSMISINLSWNKKIQQNLNGCVSLIALRAAFNTVYILPGVNYTVHTT